MNCVQEQLKRISVQSVNYFDVILELNVLMFHSETTPGLVSLQISI